FFQAEDGIRDRNVTGVQTCALPISNAPKGGDVRLPAIGTFDNLNPFVLKGVAAAGLGQLFDTLTVASADEPSSEYGLIAESVEVDRKSTRLNSSHVSISYAVFCLKK